MLDQADTLAPLPPGLNDDDQERVSRASAAATFRAYRSDWRMFVTWCAARHYASVLQVAEPDRPAGNPTMTVRAALLLALIASPAVAATPTAYAVLDRQSARACSRASALDAAKVAPAVRFSDTMLVDARIVTGTWRPAHMKRASATMLCLYNRRTRQAEVQEIALPATATPVALPDIKDRWWQVEDIAGSGVIDGSRVVLMLGSDGKLAAKACNNHSMNYALTGSALRVYPPMLGTKMACPPAIMAQEARFLDILGTATRVTAAPDGSLNVSGSDGRALRLTASAAAP